MLVYRGVFCGHVSFIPLQGIWDVALRKGPTTSVYPASGGPRRRGLVQCLHFGILLPQILGELIRSDECLFFNGLKVETGNYSQQIQTPPTNWMNWWVAGDLWTSSLHHDFSCRKHSQHQATHSAAGWKRWDPLQKTVFFLVFQGWDIWWCFWFLFINDRPISFDGHGHMSYFPCFYMSSWQIAFQSKL